MPGIGTAGSGVSVFSYFGVCLFFKIGDSVPLGCLTRGRDVVGDPISSSVLIVDVGEGIRGTPGIGTDGFLVDGDVGMDSPEKFKHGQFSLTIVATHLALALLVPLKMWEILLGCQPL